MVTLRWSKDNTLINIIKLNDQVSWCPLLTVPAGYKIRIDEGGKASFLTLPSRVTELMDFIAGTPSVAFF
jgi:hypothetical protein